MQMEILRKQHEDFLLNVVGVDPEKFKAMSYDELDKLADEKIIPVECDGAENWKVAAEIVDIIYGPYDSDEFNTGSDDESLEEAV